MDEQKPDIKQLVADAIAKFREEHAWKSFSGRHPELGKMKNCAVCGLRHRAIKVCKQKILTPAANTRKGVYGAAAFAKRRIKPHHSHALLQLVQLTQDLFDNYYPRIADPEKAMHAARGQALQELRRKRRTIRAGVQQRQHESRQINRGL